MDIFRTGAVVLQDFGILDPLAHISNRISHEIAAIRSILLDREGELTIPAFATLAYLSSNSCSQQPEFLLCQLIRWAFFIRYFPYPKE